MKFHASGLSTECGYKWHMYETRRWLRPAWAPFMRGTFVHAARAWALAHYANLGELPEPHMCIEAGVQGLDVRLEEDAEKGTPFPTDAERAAVHMEASPLVVADRLLVLPKIAPHIIAAEETVEVDIGGGHTLTGTFDARSVDPVSGTGVVPDLKTKVKTPSKPDLAEARRSLQLAAYALLHKERFGNIPLHAIDFVWASPKGPNAKTKADRPTLTTMPIEVDGRKMVGAHQRVTIQRTPDDLKVVLRWLRFRVDALEAGWHPPAFQGYNSPCARCEHAGNDDLQQRCPWSVTCPTT